MKLNQNQKKSQPKVTAWTIVGSFIILTLIVLMFCWMIILDYKTPWGQ